MPVADKIAALVEALRREPDAFATMPPAERRRLADVCRYIADRADPPADTAGAAKSGVLHALRYARGHE
jgi:hypothetical protein